MLSLRKTAPCLLCLTIFLAMAGSSPSTGAPETAASPIPLERPVRAPSPGAAPAARAGHPGFVTVLEMITPPGMVYTSASQARSTLTRSVIGREALDQFETRLTRQWADLHRLDFGALARFHTTLTRGWTLPPEPALSHGQVIGRSQDRTTLYLELRGPRLPAPYAIVFRYAMFYGAFHLNTGRWEPTVVTIRGWVEE